METLTHSPSCVARSSALKRALGYCQAGAVEPSETECLSDVLEPVIALPCNCTELMALRRLPQEAPGGTTCRIACGHTAVGTSLVTICRPCYLALRRVVEAATEVYQRIAPLAMKDPRVTMIYLGDAIAEYAALPTEGG